MNQTTTPWQRREQIGDCTLYLGDCIEIMPTLGQVDAVVTDPPYCSGGATEATRVAATHQGLRSETIRSGRFSWFDSDNMTTAGLCELLRSMCVRAPIPDTGSILVFCDWRMSTMLAPAMESAGFRLRNMVFWDKGHFGAGTGFRPRHEMILHLTKRSPTFYSASVGNVIADKRVGAAREHPTQKPIFLMVELIRVVSPEGGLVLDPFMGSGSTAVGAISIGRSFIGIERSSKYFDIACKRIRDVYAQPDFFVEKPKAPEQMLIKLDAE